MKSACYSSDTPSSLVHFVLWLETTLSESQSFREKTGVPLFEGARVSKSFKFGGTVGSKVALSRKRVPSFLVLKLSGSWLKPKTLLKELWMLLKKLGMSP